MSDFRAKILAELDLSKIPQQLRTIATQNVKLSNVTINTAQFSSSALANLQSQLNNLSANINITVNGGAGGTGASAQINNINHSLAQITTTAGNASNTIQHMRDVLSKAKFSSSAIDTITQNLSNMKLAIKEITTDVNGKNLNMKIKGTDELGRTVTILKEYDYQSGKVINIGKRISQSFDDGSAAAKKLADTLQAAQNSLQSGKVDSTIRSIESQIKSLSTSGHSGIQGLQDDLNDLNRLRNEMANAPDDSSMASHWNRYIGLLETVQNKIKTVSIDVKESQQNLKLSDDQTAFMRKIQDELSALTPETEKFRAQIETIRNSVQGADSAQLTHLKKEFTEVSAAVEKEKKAVEEAAKAQLTLSRSNTLSNNIQTWMNNNTKAAEVFGQELVDLQNKLNGNTDAASLQQIGQRFREIQSEAKAAGLTTNTFGNSLKNVALQVLGLGSAVMVIQKLISTIKQGVNTVVELDTALVDLQKTSTATPAQLNQFYREANQIAKEYGTTTKQIIQGAAD